jgi:hypothetical protein
MERKEMDMTHIEHLSRLRTRLRTEWFLRLYTEWIDDVMARRGHCTQRVIMVTALCSPDWPIFETRVDWFWGIRQSFWNTAVFWDTAVLGNTAGFGEDGRLFGRRQAFGEDGRLFGRRHGSFGEDGRLWEDGRLLGRRQAFGKTAGFWEYGRLWGIRQSFGNTAGFWGIPAVFHPFTAPPSSYPSPPLATIMPRTRPSRYHTAPRPSSPPLPLLLPRQAKSLLAPSAIISLQTQRKILMLQIWEGMGDDMVRFLHVAL